MDIATYEPSKSHHACTPESEEPVVCKQEGLQIADVLLRQAEVGPREGARALALLHLGLRRRRLSLRDLGLGCAGLASLQWRPED